MAISSEEKTTSVKDLTCWALVTTNRRVTLPKEASAVANIRKGNLVKIKILAIKDTGA